MSKFTGSHLIAKTLKELGVEYAFGVPGGQLVLLIDALEKEGIKFIMTRHEQAAAHMADAYFRLTGRLAVAIGTVGPGAADLVPGVYEAFVESSAMLVLTAQNQRWRIYPDTGAFQAGDHTGMFRPITKMSEVIWESRRIVELLNLAVRKAVSLTPGPVHLDLPADVLFSEAEQPAQLRMVEEFSLPAPLPEVVDKVKELILSSEKIVIHAGGGVLRAGACSQLLQLAELLQAPVTSTVGARGVFPEDHPLCFLPLGFGAISAQAEADLVLALGLRFSAMDMWGQPPTWSQEQKVVHVDANPDHLGLNRRVDVAVLSDIKTFLEALIKALEGKKIKPNPGLQLYREVEQSWMEEFLQLSRSDSVPMHPLRMVAEVYKHVEAEDVVVLDGGNIQVWANYLLRRPLPYRYLSQANSGMLGGGLPKAIAACLVYPERKVFLITGDGSFLFNLQELETAARLGLKNLIIVVANDRRWGMIRAEQKELDEIGVNFYDIDHAKIAEAMGGVGFRVERPEHLAVALEDAIRADRFAVIDALIDREANLHPPDLESLEAIWMEGVDIF